MPTYPIVVRVRQVLIGKFSVDCAKGYALLVRVANSLQSAFLLFSACTGDGSSWSTLGQAAQSGDGKGYFGSLGLPAPYLTACFVSILELVADCCWRSDLEAG